MKQHHHRSQHSLKAIALAFTLLLTGLTASAQTDFEAPKVQTPKQETPPKVQIPKQKIDAPAKTDSKPKQTYTKKKAHITEKTARPKAKNKGMRTPTKKTPQLSTYIEPERQDKSKELEELNNYELEVKAAQGDVEAQYLIGERWIFADNDPDIIKGIGWLQKAAEQEHSWAQTLLGYVYYAIDEGETAGQYFYRAALNDNPVAMYLLGIALATGDCGFQKDMSTAVQCFAFAAQYEVPAAQYSIGVALYYGIGVEQILEWAKGWMERAARNGDEDAQAFLANNRFDQAPVLNTGEMAFTPSPTLVREARTIITKTHVWALNGVRRTASGTECHMMVTSRVPETAVCMGKGVYLIDEDSGKKYLFTTCDELPLEPEWLRLSEAGTVHPFIVRFPALPKNVKTVTYYYNKDFFFEHIPVE